uniref:Nudix hydrolase 16 like 1 n=1 Tax=Athene cunicularia TaxID=194338 RepID=A0A663LKJ5_ATHCN
RLVADGVSPSSGAGGDGARGLQPCLSYGQCRAGGGVGGEWSPWSMPPSPQGQLRSVLLQVMGMVRVPLYTQKDRMGGLPNFLGNSFVGTAKFQLLFALKILNMVPEEKLAEAVAATQKPKKPAIDQAAGATGNLPAAKPVNELAAPAKAGNELAERAENEAAVQAAAEAAEQAVAGLESGAVAEQLVAVPVAEAVEQPVGLGANAVVEQPVAEAME